MFSLAASCLLIVTSNVWIVPVETEILTVIRTGTEVRLTYGETVGIGQAVGFDPAKMRVVLMGAGNRAASVCIRSPNGDVSICCGDIITIDLKTNQVNVRKHRK